MSHIDHQAEYRRYCTEHNVKPNSGLLAMLPTAGELKELNLSGTLVGNNGLKPVADLVKISPELQVLNLSGQKLNSEVVQELLEALKVHPGLTSLDISGSHCPLAGPALLELVKKNPQVTRLNFVDCAIRPMFEKLVDLQLAKNRDGAEKTQDGEGKTAAEEELMQQQAGGDEAAGAFGEFAESFAPAQQPYRPEILRPGSSTRRDKRRPTVCSEVWADKDIDTFQAPVVPKPEEASRWLCERLEHVHLFSHLDDRELKMAVQAMDERRFSMGDLIVTQGEDGGDRYYVIYSGECDCTVDESVQAIKKGDHFGEVQLLYHQEETATVKVTSSEVVVYSIEREVYRRILAKASKVKRAMYGGFLQKVKFLTGMTRAEQLQLADALKSVRVKSKDNMIRYGEEGQWFYLIIEGTVEVIGRDNKGEKVKVCEFTVGDCVGELEFINNHKCVADVVAIDEVRAAKMNRRHFEMCMGPVVDVLKRTADTSNVYEYYRKTIQETEKEKSVPTSVPECTSGDEDAAFGGFGTVDPFKSQEEVARPTRGRRQTVSAEVITEEDVESFKPIIVPKDDTVKSFISAALERMPLFCHLESFELTQLALAMEEMKFAKNEVIVDNGNEGDMFYLIGRGEVHGVSPDESEPVEYTPGQHFGEVVLMYSQSYPMTYKAASHDTICYTLDRNTYKHIMQKASMKKRAMYGDFLKKVGFLQTCSHAELLQLADALKPSSYADGEHLIHYGDDGTWFYIIVKGTVEVWGRDSEMTKKKVCEFSDGDCVGELEFINNHKCVADVVAKGPVRTAKMHRHHFEMCMGPIVDILRRQADTNQVYEYYRQTLAGNNAPVSK